MSSTCSLISSTSRYQMTAGATRGSPEAVRISRTNWSYGLFSYRLFQIHSWNA